MNIEEQIASRRAEVEQYQINIDNFQSILSSISTELPEHLEQYRSATNHHDVVKEIDDIDDVRILSEVWFAEELKWRVKTELVEQTKAKAILDALERQQSSGA